MHAAAMACLALAWRSGPLTGAIFGTGVLLVAAVLVYEHAVLAQRGKAGIPMAFFTLNGIVSCVLGVAGIAEVLV
jgi:4-hydroxybenzoate polyprenyltransferase